MRPEARPLGCVLDLVIDHRGRTPKKLGGDFTSAGVPVISARNVKEGRIIDAGELRYVDFDTWHRWMPHRLEAEDVLLTSEAPLGETAILGDSNEFCLGQRLFGLRAKKGELAGPYLYYWLQSPDGQAQLERRASGTTAQGIRQEELLEVVISFPEDLAEQLRAVAPLRALDESIAANRRVAKTIEDLVVGLFRLWFVETDPDGLADVLSQLPRRMLPIGPPRTEWNRGVLGDVGNNIRVNVKAGEIPAGAAYVGLEHLPRKRLSIETWTSGDSVLSNTTKFRRGDYLFGKLRPYFHKVAIAPVDGSCSTDILVLRPVSAPWGPFFLAHLFSRELIDFVSGASGGTRMPRTSWQSIARYEVAMPPEAVATAFEDVTRPLFQQLQSLIERNRVLVDLGRTILPPLIGGAVDAASLIQYARRES